MKKNVSTISLALALIASAAGFSQTKTIIPCATDEAMELHFSQNPEARKSYEAAQRQLDESRLAIESGAARPSAVEYTIPVVFHVLHQGGPENISDAACLAALTQINKDYARQSQDTAGIFTPFKNLYIPSDIKLMPAQKDPQGNCINGVVHHFDVKTNWDQGQAQSNSLYWSYTWDPTRYLNIYIVANIAPQGTVTGGGIIVGYTYIPGTWPTGNSHDAIVYRYNFLGTGFPDPQCRSLSHEMGHWFSLKHTFGNTNNPGVVCGDDGILDTPPTKGNFGTCPASSTNTAYTCTSPNPSNSNNYYQNVNNIMDYSGCPLNFTQGQTTAMRNTLANTVANRANLWSPSNLVFTGINNNTPCAPIADFLSTTNSYSVCAGGNLNLKDFSYNAVITNYSWAADNGAVITAPTASQTIINFPVVGVTNVSLTVSNLQGSSTKVRTVYVVDGSPAVTGPDFESFENGLPPYWEVGNTENDASTWEITSNASYDQSYSYYIDGSTRPAGTTDYLQTPIMDIKNNVGNIYQFAYAYRRMNSTQSDVLKIQASRDCGGTWGDILILSANVMSQNSGGTSTDPFIPNSPSEWKTYIISDHPLWLNYINSSSVMVRFTFVEGSIGYGNNIYVDAINFWSPNGVNELTRSIEFGLYPNPTDGDAVVHFNTSNSAKVAITVKDMLGRDVLKVADKTYDAGEQNININAASQLQSGIYLVNMNINGAVISRKLIVK